MGSWQVEYVECHYETWCYDACKVCYKKVDEFSPGKYNCSVCTKTYGHSLKRFEKAVLNNFQSYNIVNEYKLIIVSDMTRLSYILCRYRFVINIVDNTSNASLLMWDRELAILLGKKVSNVIVTPNEVYF